MEKSRNEILKSNEDYEGMSWETLPINHLHVVCKAAVQKCIPLIDPLKMRFDNLRGQTRLERKDELEWLVHLLKGWFVKSWNTKRGADMRKTDKKHKLPPTCDACGQNLQLLCCSSHLHAHEPLGSFSHGR